MRLLPVTRIALGAGLLLAPALPAGQLAAARVDFAPAVAAKMQRYGESEEATLREAILTAVSRETARVDIPAGLAVSVTVQDIAPTHPTRKQVGDEPSLDVVRTKFMGGAELSGEVRDVSGQVLRMVTYRHFAPTLRQGSSSLDPWADARLAIDSFAAKLAAACRDLRNTSSHT